jgi:hypothetical protein
LNLITEAGEAPALQKSAARVYTIEDKPLRFEVNGEMFFVNFVPEEGRWFCYALTAAGMQRVPVSMDSTPFESFTVQQDEQAKEVVN